MDNNNRHENSSFNDPINWKALGFFNAEDYLLYIFKKTEKITAALYLVSGLLKDDEPIKWELRDRGVELLNSSFTASSSMPVDRNSVIQSLFSSALETISLLNVARVSNLISVMNHQILVKEIDQVLALLRDRLAASAENAGLVLSENFFKTPDLFSSGFRNAQEVGSSKRLFNSQRRDSDHGVNSLKNHDLKDVNKGQSDFQQKKEQRQRSILQILKGQNNLTIKDFSRVMTDCSEKTIQRELIEMVNKGIIKKEGERRWSRYSLV